jgi:hypothetical protein
MIGDREGRVRYLLSVFGILVFALGGALTMLNLNDIIASSGQWPSGVGNFLSGVLLASC